MQPEEASDIDQLINRNMKIASWGVAVFLLGIDRDNERERPVGTTARNVTSRANNRAIAPTTRGFPLNREPNGSTTPTGQKPTEHYPL
jgi:hypothetical protein